MEKIKIHMAGWDITEAMKLIANGVPTGKTIPGPDGVVVNVKRSPGPRAIRKQLREDNPEMEENTAKDLTIAIKNYGFHQPEVARYRLENEFLGDVCPICDANWTSKVRNNLQIERVATPEDLMMLTGVPELAAEYAGQILMINCRDCSLKMKNLHFVVITTPESKQSMQVLQGYVPLVPRAMIPKMRQLWENASGNPILYRARTNDAIKEYFEEHPEEAKDWGIGSQPQPLLLNASGKPVIH